MTPVTRVTPPFPGRLEACEECANDFRDADRDDLVEMLAMKGEFARRCSWCFDRKVKKGNQNLKIFLPQLLVASSAIVNKVFNNEVCITVDNQGCDSITLFMLAPLHSPMFEVGFL